MKLYILTQGLTESTETAVGTVLINLLNSTDYKRFTFLSAFASLSGINGLSPHIAQAKQTYEDLTIVVGVDQQGTSKEALDALRSLDVNAFIWYQSGLGIFHPKLYLFEGERYSQLIIGSSNLTRQGLFVNVETSVQIELDHAIADDKRLLDDLKAHFVGFFDSADANLQPITKELIDQFVAERIVPTEADRKEILTKINKPTAEGGTQVDKLIRAIFPGRKLPVVPKEFRSKKPAQTPISAKRAKSGSARKAKSDTGSTNSFTLAWQRRVLPASSVEIAGTANTNPTGGLRLVQDKFEINGSVIDQTIYFRHSVFGGLPWATEKMAPLVEKAIGRFHVTVLGDDLGIIPLEIRHKPSGEAGQHNYTTSISWGSLSKIIRAGNLAKRTLNLYQSTTEPDVFRLEII